MAYVTREQIEDAAGGAAALVQLADLAENGAIDEPTLERVQAAVEAMAGGYVRVRYNEADILLDVDPQLADVVAKEIVYALRRDVRRLVLDEDERLNHEERLRWLAGVADGTVRLADPQPAKSSNVTGSYVYNESATSRANLKGFT